MAEPTVRQIKRFGWKPDIPDARDQMLHLPLRQRIILPREYDPRASMPPVYDQGDLGSCTGNAIAGAIQYTRMKQKLPNFVPSRLFIYYNERVIEGTVTQDSGAMIRDGIKSVAAQGACSEVDWPYDIKKFAVKPPDNAYADAKKDLVTKYSRIPQTANYLKAALVQGYPIVFGFTVYESFETSQVAHTGIMSMPGMFDHVIGGHAVMMVGYSNARMAFIVRNSWGPNWGANGYFYMPYSYALNSKLAQDFWTVEAVGA